MLRFCHADGDTPSEGFSDGKVPRQTVDAIGNVCAQVNSLFPGKVESNSSPAGRQKIGPRVGIPRRCDLTHSAEQNKAKIPAECFSILALNCKHRMVPISARLVASNVRR